VSFFDKQQEVIDIKLTQFGKNLLSRGKFKPVFYQFFDDGVLYNSDFCGNPEEQNRSEDRIFEAPQRKTQHLASSVDGGFNDFEYESPVTDPEKELAVVSPETHTTNKILRYPLRNSSIDSQNAPQFYLVATENKIESSKDKYITEVGSFDVPQINFSSSYNISRNIHDAIPVNEVASSVRDFRRYFDLTSSKIVFLNNSFIEVSGGDVSIELEELNTLNVLENFEIEVFEIHEVENRDTKESLTRLSETKVKELFDISVDKEVSSTRITDQRNSIFDGDR
tara:strand:+ start:21978 stop:22820 length:843 start_codon:yes stop_codon:yes gene_type:complete